MTIVLITLSALDSYNGHQATPQAESKVALVSGKFPMLIPCTPSVTNPEARDSTVLATPRQQYAQDPRPKTFWSNEIM